MDKDQQIAAMRKALAAAKRALDYCGGGDAWERECNEPDMKIVNDACDELKIDDSE